MVSDFAGIVGFSGASRIRTDDLLITNCIGRRPHLSDQ